jgi:L-Lysine epsilon oxidase N-terminal/L-lysine epsilon oxidase C-terminal domain
MRSKIMPKHFEVHPSIGIARVGNSPSESEFFLGPEPGVAPPEKYRDSSGQYKRQAARFRVFDCERDRKGKLLRATEVDPTIARITWTVHMVNRKGAAPRFTGTGNRNQATGDDSKDQNLIIDPGEKSVIGSNQGPVLLDAGKFMGVAVPLGSIRTDEAGRLIVLGGFGTSDSVPPQPNPSLPIQNFADSDGWHDDVSDGPVRAKVTLIKTGKVAEAKPAWVIVTPPDFAPDIQNLITLYDAAYQVAVERGLRTVPRKPSFTGDIQPILNRAVGYQWVNKYNRRGHGGGTSGDFSVDWSQLADPATSRPLAKNILAQMRNPNKPEPPAPVPHSVMPRLHDETNSTQVLPLTKTQYAVLQKWADGNYINDLGQAPPPMLLPDALDRAALEACAGGAFFPGIEAGRIMKKKESYSEAFRLDVNTLKPGQVTQGNALPWQADFYECRWEGQSFIGWWPAQRPDHILPEADPTKTKDWMRGIGSDLALTRDWHHLGIVVRRAGPPELFLETERDPAFLPK